jgi:pyridoxine 5-phosphate synthase
MQHLRLGINIDHVATVRNARGEAHPDPIRAAKIAQSAGADGITAHLREDRRHIRDNDIFRIKEEIALPLNFEMAATDEMLEIALKVKPNACCLVPEKRTEVTTEGGLDIISNQKILTPYIQKLKGVGIRVSLFIDPHTAQVEASKNIGADIIELHTGSYCHAESAEKKAQLQRIITAAKTAEQVGIECHAGHGLSFDNVKPIAAIANIIELNIGHFLIGEAIFIGLEASIKQMRKLMDEARG